MFIEEPVLSEDLDSFLGPLINTATPIALGERLYSRWDFKSILASGAVDIIQPDPSHAGGIPRRARSPRCRGVRRRGGVALSARSHCARRLSENRWL
jgi:hypothetical protein